MTDTIEDLKQVTTTNVSEPPQTDKQPLTVADVAKNRPIKLENFLPPDTKADEAVAQAESLSPELHEKLDEVASADAQDPTPGLEDKAFIDALRKTAK